MCDFGFFPTAPASAKYSVSASAGTYFAIRSNHLSGRSSVLTLSAALGATPRAGTPNRSAVSSSPAGIAFLPNAFERARAASALVIIFRFIQHLSYRCLDQSFRKSAPSLRRRTPGIYRIFVRIAVSLLCGLWSTNSLAVPQRMYLPPQAFTIQPAGTKAAGAMCLDFGANSPGRSTQFGAAPMSLGDIRVSVSGHGTFSLQEAIDKKVISVSGTGGFHKVEFRNLIPDAAIHVSVDSGSILLPHGTAQSPDLNGIPALATAAHIDSSSHQNQLRLWDLRAQHTADLLKIHLSVAALDKYALDAYTLFSTNKWVQDKFARSPSQPVVVLERVSSDKIYTIRQLDSLLHREYRIPIKKSADVEYVSLTGRAPPEPLYILYVPHAAPRIFEGQGGLAHASVAIRDAWTGMHLASAPRVLMMGDGSNAQFDAARLNLDFAAAKTAAGGGGRIIIGNGIAESFSFEPPSGSLPPTDKTIYKDGPWHLMAERDKKRNGLVSVRQAFLNRGYVQVMSKTRKLVTEMAAAARTVIDNPSMGQSPPRRVATALIKVLRTVVTVAFGRDEHLAREEGNAPAVVVEIDNRQWHQRIQPCALQRLAECISKSIIRASLGRSGISFLVAQQ